MYKQVPYIDRYYFISYGVYTSARTEIAKIPHGLPNFVWALFKAHCGDKLYSGYMNRWDRFQARVDKYNSWLDNQAEFE